MQQKTVIIVVGPTAVGKTAMSVRLARYYKTEIISADSRQCFRELNIGVAKPDPEEMQGIIHHFISSHSIEDAVSAATFEEYALRALERIFLTHEVALVTGGTGLYVRALTEGFDEIPPVPELIREAVRELYTKGGLQLLADSLIREDPAFAMAGEMQNPQRMMRALEVIRSTGKSIRTFQMASKAKRNFRIIQIGLDIPRDQLYERINNRVDKMMSRGLLNEVKALYPYRHLNSLQTVGYRELFDYLDGHCSLEQAVEKIKQNTRHYAKRQLTWFRPDPTITWFAPDDFKGIITFLENRL